MNISDDENMKYMYIMIFLVIISKYIFVTRSKMIYRQIKLSVDNNRLIIPKQASLVSGPFL